MRARGIRFLSPHQHPQIGGWAKGARGDKWRQGVRVAREAKGAEENKGQGMVEARRVRGKIEQGAMGIRGARVFY